MCYRLLFLFASLLLVFSSCIEIIDDLSLNADGSGTFKYVINLSSSKVKINSILALDSLDGKKVPSKDEISNKANRVVSLLKEQDGISNVLFESNYNDYILRLQCDFASLEKLQAAFREVILSESHTKDIPELEQTWLTFSDQTLVRSIPQITVKKSREINQGDRDLLKNGSYTSITRFQSEVDHFDNEDSRLSKNKKAVMIRTDPYSLTQNPNLLDNTIYLVKSE